MYICQSQYSNPSYPASSLSVHMFVLYICVSISAFWISLSVPFLWIPHMCDICFFCHLFFDSSSLYFFFCKREVVEQWHQPSFHLWFCNSPWLLHIGIHIWMGHIAPFSPTELICSLFQEGGRLGELPSWESKCIIHLVKLLSNA